MAQRQPARSIVEPPCVLTIGITGHRPNRLPQDLGEIEAAIARVLDAMVKHGQRQAKAGGFAGGTAALRFASALAQGADSLAAQAAVEAGLELVAFLPFGRDDYRLDFGEPDVRDRYDALLRHAAEVTELDGDRDRANAAYEAVGLEVLSVSDVLLAVWDGKSSAGPGGTAEIIGRAVESGVPVVWIPTTPGAEIQVIWNGLVNAPMLRPTLWSAPRAGFARSIGRVMANVLAPPQDPSQARICAELSATDRRLALNHRTWLAL